MSLSAPSDGDLNRATAAYAIIWVESGLALLIVVLRVWARLNSKALGQDDYWMVLSLAILIVNCAMMTRLGALGGFRHMYYLEQGPPSTLVAVTRTNYIVQGIVTFAYAPSKTSVGLLVLRIIGNSQGSYFIWYKRVIYTVLALVWASTIVCVALTYAQCSPTAALWDTSITDKHCWDPTIQPKFAIYTSAVNILCDLILAAIPSILIFNLNMNARKKVNLSILLGLGILAAVSAIVKTTYLLSLANHADITWEDYSLIVWATSELFIIIFCGSIPPLSPLWNRYVMRKRTGYTNDYRASGPYYRHDAERTLDGTINPLTEIGASSKKVDATHQGIMTRTDIEISSHSEWSGKSSTVGQEF